MSNEVDFAKITKDVQTALNEFLPIAKLQPGDFLVVGCSSSEIMGGHIGKDSSLEAAQAVFAGIYPLLKEKGIFLGAQCCEHLNRAVVVERQLAKERGFEIVNAVPQLHAGGSWSMTCYQEFADPVVVETVAADAGFDIGDTLIGMHLRRVAEPVRLSVKKIGEANFVAARVRPKYIGGQRAVYFQA